MLTTWPTRLWAFLLATLYHSLSISLSLSISPFVASREDSLYSILTVPTRARTAHLQLAPRSNFREGKKKKNRDPDINVATTRFTRIYNA